MYRLVIRADSNFQIGTGHVMRCVALGQAWKDQGGQVSFFSYCESIALQQFIRDEGFDLTEVENPHPDSSDLIQLKIHLKQHNETADAIWVVLDGYHFTSDYQKAIRKAGFRLMVIDDYNHLPEYHADILLNQNIGAEQLNYTCNLESLKLLGSRYVMLRRDFSQYKNFKRIISQKAKNILITLGGADPDNITLKVINALKKSNDLELDIRVIIGPSNPNRSVLENAIKKFESKILFVSPSPDQMPDLMAWAELAITAGGSTCWELCFMQVPMFVLIAAENQREICRRLDENFMGCCLGWYHDFSEKESSSKINKLIKDYSTRHHMVEQEKSYVDGKGLKRILRQLLVGNFQLRLWKMQDCEHLWVWANDSLVRENSFNAEPILWNEHKKWFEHKIMDSNAYAYIAITELGESIAQIRFEVSEQFAEINYSIAPSFRGIGIAELLIQKGIQRFKTDHKGILNLQALVKPQNKTSNHIFMKLGFVQFFNCSKNQEFIIWRYKL
ncbi:MAG: UDP-2,4-diacetamido-2,4,6-trideoxy-beta-L-altropyranose hydrolase [Desulfobacteraceae bacterium]|jgi:UDP-2,4-diacetamido-2,4,6-trideoxy-beta-L-altropyranose hydrolase|nr:UDP-2,4-diacetamido-2,4,6-trideoxy-beta-L-altropyranose hydrolase [Desulfobacteraceae bacterium]